MPDDPQNQGATPDAETEEAETAETSPAAEGTDGEMPEGAKAALKKARDEARKAEKARKAAEARIAELETADLSEKERFERERDEAKSAAEEARVEARDARLEAAILREANEFRNPADALELGRSRIEFDDDGKPTNVRETLAELLAERPYLKRGVADIGATNAEAQRTGKIKREDLATMSPADINKARQQGELAHLM